MMREEGIVSHYIEWDGAHFHCHGVVFNPQNYNSFLLFMQVDNCLKFLSKFKPYTLFEDAYRNSKAGDCSAAVKSHRHPSQQASSQQPRGTAPSSCTKKEASGQTQETRHLEQRR